VRESRRADLLLGALLASLLLVVAWLVERESGREKSHHNPEPQLDLENVRKTMPPVNDLPLEDRLRTISGGVIDLAGMLATIGGAIIIFVLSPGFFPDQTGWLWQTAVVLLLLSVSCYSMSAVTAVWMQGTRLERVSLYGRWALLLAIAATLLELLALGIMLWALQLKFAFSVAIVILAVALLVAKHIYSNFRRIGLVGK